MKVPEIRNKYLKFFKEQGHAILESASLIPENDPTTLFTGSGMQPMVPFLLGETHPSGVRLVDSQKCFRTQDIEEVGDSCHTTFFEMLGNWSLGDYFKSEQLNWVFQFLTGELGLDPHRLYVTVFRGNDDIQKDNESVEIWKNIFSKVGIDASDIDMAQENGMQGGRIFYYDEKKNWWSRSGVPTNMPVGEPGGPDSELFWDFGEELRLHEKSVYKDRPCHVNCECGRFVELGNSVFMQFQKVENGFKPLSQKNVDFGGGLERIASAVKNDPDIFNVDVFAKMKLGIEQLSGIKYGGSLDSTKNFRVILDHLRAAVFLISDGALPSNKDQGYFVRRLIRRAVRFGKKLGIKNTFCAKISKNVIDEYADSYPDLLKNQEMVISEINNEEEKFNRTLEKGEREFEKIFSSHGSITGQDAFVLYCSYGFPLELTEEIALEKGQNVDKETFYSEFKKHQDLSRAGSSQKFSGGLADHSIETVRLHTATHLLHKALRIVLGDHVEQKGSNITPERLRFDFSHSKKMTDEEIKKVEEIVNENIQKNLSVHYEILDLNEATKCGAIGLFQDKYASLGGKVKVYFIGDQLSGECFSVEVCGGPHIEHTSELGHFQIVKEEAVASGVRRIKAELK